jgi:hypothetical protein
MQDFFYFLERLFNMLDRVLENLQRINPLGIIAFVIAGFITYGAGYIATVVLKVPTHKAFKVIVVLKVLGVLLGLLGLYAIVG